MPRRITIVVVYCNVYRYINISTLELVDKYLCDGFAVDLVVQETHAKGTVSVTKEYQRVVAQKASQIAVVVMTN